MGVTPERAGWTVMALGAVGILLGAALAGETAPIAVSQAGMVSPERARLAEIQVELTWLADPATYPCQLAARVVGSTLEVGGLVNDQNMRQKVMQLAQARSGLPVQDKLKILPGSAPASKPASSEQLCRGATMALSKVMAQKTEPFEISADGTGQITVSGTVSSWEEKLDISRRLSQIPGSTSVINQVKVARQDQGGKPCTWVSTDGKLLLPGDPADYDLKALPLMAPPAPPAAVPTVGQPKVSSQGPAWSPDAKPVAPVLMSKKEMPPAPRVSVYAQASPGKQAGGSPYGRPEATSSMAGNQELARASTAAKEVPAGLPADVVESKPAACVIQTEIVAPPKQLVVIPEAASPYKGSVLVHATATLPGFALPHSPYDASASAKEPATDKASPYRGTMFLPEDKTAEALPVPVSPKESPYTKKAPVIADSNQAKASASSPYSGDASLASSSADSGQRSAYGVSLPTPEAKQIPKQQAKAAASPYGASRFAPEDKEMHVGDVPAPTSSAYDLRMVVSSKHVQSKPAPQGVLLAHAHAIQAPPVPKPEPAKIDETADPTVREFSSPPAANPIAQSADPKEPSSLPAAKPIAQSAPAQAWRKPPVKPAKLKVEQTWRPVPVNRALPTTAPSWRYADAANPAAAPKQMEPEVVKQAAAVEMAQPVEKAPTIKPVPVPAPAPEKDTQVVQAVWKQPARPKPAPVEPAPLAQNWLPPLMKEHLKQSIEAACSGEVQGLEIIPCANYTLKVRLEASNAQEGQQLARKILNLRELKRYKVDMDVRLKTR